jgi:hypothetical protein
MHKARDRKRKAKFDFKLYQFWSYLPLTLAESGGICVLWTPSILLCVNFDIFTFSEIFIVRGNHPSQWIIYKTLNMSSLTLIRNRCMPKIKCIVGQRSIHLRKLGQLYGLPRKNERKEKGEWKKNRN